MVTSPLRSLNSRPLWIDTHLLGTGTESGGLYALQCPTLERYSSVRAHTQRVSSLRPAGQNVLSLSSDRVRMHASGGMPKMTFQDAEVGPSTVLLHSAKTALQHFSLVCHVAMMHLSMQPLLPALLDRPGCLCNSGSLQCVWGAVQGGAFTAMELHASRLMLGQQSGALLELDLATRTVFSKVCCASGCLLPPQRWHWTPSKACGLVCCTSCC